MAKNRVITWDQFDILVRCNESCPLWISCMFGEPMGTQKTATNCKAWRRLPTEQKPNAGGE